MADRKDLTVQAEKWIAEAEQDKRLHEIWLRDAYRFCMPWRKRPGDNSQQQPVHDQDELFDSTAIEALQDFAADAQADYTPVEKDWLKVEAAQKVSVNAAEMEMLKRAMVQYQASNFAEIRRSNFHEAAQECYPDLGIGTCAMIIQDLDANDPIHCQSVPLTDLLIVRGCYGGLDFKGRRQSPKYNELKHIYRNADIEHIRGKVDSNDASRCKAVECFWRLRDVPRVERWQYALMIDGKVCEDFIYEGTGSCPLIVARWRTDSTTAWGVGPVYTTLPTIKTLDQLCYLILKYLNKNVDPATYSDGEVNNLENGIVPGTHLEVPPGSEIKILESENAVEPAFFERSGMKQDIKESLFQGKPEQRGDTPPTATQWYDERRITNRRKGASIGRLNSEWQWASFARFAYLNAKRGVLPEVRLNGELVRLRPESPLVTAQKEEEVLTAHRLLQMVAEVFGPDKVPLVANMFETVNEWKDRLGADAVILNSQEEIQALMAQMAQVAASAQQGQQQAA